MSNEHQRVGTFCDKCRQVMCKCVSKEQTAVEWLREQFHKVPFSQFGNLFEQAKEMEKEQIIEHHTLLLSGVMGEISAREDAEQYYNDTYGE